MPNQDSFQSWDSLLPAVDSFFRNFFSDPFPHPNILLHRDVEAGSVRFRCESKENELGVHAAAAFEIRQFDWPGYKERNLRLIAGQHQGLHLCAGELLYRHHLLVSGVRGLHSPLLCWLNIHYCSWVLRHPHFRLHLKSDHRYFQAIPSWRRPELDGRTRRVRQLDDLKRTSNFLNQRTSNSRFQTNSGNKSWTFSSSSSWKTTKPSTKPPSTRTCQSPFRLKCFTTLRSKSSTNLFNFSVSSRTGTW